MEEKLFECHFCPCRFLTRTGFEWHMRSFGNDPVRHLNRFMESREVSPGRRRELRRLYLEGRAEDRDEEGNFR